MGLFRFGLQATVSVVVICLCEISLTVSQECRDYGEDGRHCIDSFDELPQDNIEVNFKLYTRKHRSGVSMQFSSALHADFQFGKPIKFITHGFFSSGSKDWVTRIADELLKVGDFNVIVVDWGEAAFPDTNPYIDLKWVEYDVASSNTRIVASRIKRLLDFILMQSGSSALNDVHLIGHSLGAQVSGMVGKLIQGDCNGAPCKAARITALDPARPNFLIDAGERRRAPGPHCLSRDDADFVDVIHSDATEQDDHTGVSFQELGIYQALGHADFYPNGGNNQPGCVLTLKPYCDHGRATSLFAASINSHCSFISETCSGNFDLQNKRCSGCTSTPCQRMGYYANKPQTPTLYYLETGGDDPFCAKTEVCRDYGEDGKHCVDSFDELPQDNIEVNFKLYTRTHRHGVDMEFSSALHADFEFRKPIKFITHGFRSKGSEDWVKQIADELLKVGDFNVIVVDWEKAANPDSDLKWVEYDEASSNTRIVASRIKRLLGFILGQGDSSALNDVHLIGHSLGAQVSGMVGKWIQRDLRCNGAPCKAARITALDPARPNFLIDAGERRRAPGPHCVSRDDAIFVDVIHSDAKEQDDHTGGTFPQLGIYQALGHADFYPNGGNKQPGCILFPCDHGRATLLFAASINSHCSFISETCSGSLALQNKRCSGCTSTPCQRMGYHAIKPSTPTLYYLETTGDEPYCGHSLGCYVDSTTSRALVHQATSLTKVTINTCRFYCRGRGYPYAGLQFTSSRQSCWCGIAYNRHGRAGQASECSHTCTDAPKGYFCGGHLRNSVYKTGYVGCIQQSVSNLVHKQLALDAMYVQHCYVHCSYEGYEYAGLLDERTCACGNDQSESDIVPSSDCSTSCIGNSNERCGGPGRVSVIKTGIDADCLAKADSGDCDFFDCFNHRHTCNEGRRYDIGRTLKRYCKTRKFLSKIGFVTEKVMECVTRGIVKKYKQLPVTFSDSLCKDTFHYGKKLMSQCKKSTKVAGASSRSSSSSTNEVDFFQILKTPENMAAFKSSVDEMLAEADTGAEDSVLYLLEGEIDDIARQFGLDDYHGADASLDEMKTNIRNRIYDMFPVKNPTKGIDSSCEELARTGQCEFFSCFEKRYPCGPDGFALSFQKVCEGESRVKNYLKSNNGKPMGRVQSCVMDAMLEVYQSSENSCKRIEYSALDAYRRCYTEHMDGGFVAENQYLLTDAYTVPAANTLQTLARGLITDTLCDANGTPLYEIRNGLKIRTAFT